jgi:hypothetical protein
MSVVIVGLALLGALVVLDLLLPMFGDIKVWRLIAVLALAASGGIILGLSQMLV